MCLIASRPDATGVSSIISEAQPRVRLLIPATALHFKLALDKVDNYDDVQVTYRPQLDESRDEELIDLLPDYLVEEISFSRSYAAKFYSKVVKPLTE